MSVGSYLVNVIFVLIQETINLCTQSSLYATTVDSNEQYFPCERVTWRTVCTDVLFGGVYVFVVYIMYH